MKAARALKDFERSHLENPWRRRRERFSSGFMDGEMRCWIDRS
ncbi:MAG: hypothetical protein OEW84_06285 [Aigarchaeota archaeon]|nr:hypothetical protein [Aigarchaeota archaeon]